MLLPKGHPYKLHFRNLAFREINVRSNNCRVSGCPPTRTVMMMNYDYRPFNTMLWVLPSKCVSTQATRVRNLRVETSRRTLPLARMESFIVP